MTARPILRGRGADGKLVSIADPIDRFSNKYSMAGECWQWEGTVNSQTGYGMFWDGSRKVLAHRYSYQAHVGPIPAGLHIDHLCRNRRCVNPDHLEAVSQAENNRRAGAAVTHCPSGHAYAEHGTIRVRPNGTSRDCAECRRVAARARNSRIRAAARRDVPEAAQS